MRFYETKKLQTYRQCVFKNTDTYGIVMLRLRNLASIMIFAKLLFVQEKDFYKISRKYRAHIQNKKNYSTRKEGAGCFFPQLQRFNEPPPLFQKFLLLRVPPVFFFFFFFFFFFTKRGKLRSGTCNLVFFRWSSVLMRPKVRR